VKTYCIDVNNLILIRNISGLTQKQFAEKTGYCSGYIQAMEKGKYPVNEKFIKNLYMAVISQNFFQDNLRGLLDEIEIITEESRRIIK
jgi:transcriptional regulator with XRE-family HTH domain